ncbi:hypothetical protein HDE_10234 [Halotydeus destructor]|nr:hypothetical protein HDE_10234 [Halotydeus destructor]
MIANFLSNESENAAYAIAELKDILLLLYLVVRIDVEKATVKMAIAKMKSAMVHQQGVCDNMKSGLLNVEIRKLLTHLNLEHTAFSLFRLDRWLILNFIGALITFSVLFIQLAGVD